ncbi:MAG: TatD family hydrolase [Flavobacteriales bacterium]|jgi:TatD DNase family protein
MDFIDTHTHLFSSKFEGDNEAAVKRAIESGVSKMFLPNIDMESITPMLDLAAAFPKNCFPTIGLHPCDVKEDYKTVLTNMKALISKHKFYAIGETGLDLYWDKESLPLQIESLKIQIGWAKELDLPIIIHARDSYEELFEIFDELNDEKLTGVFHCFTGSQEQAEHIIAYGGFSLGVGGVITFKNSGLASTIMNIDLCHLVLETDSPYLSPHPNRGKRNESSYLHHIATKLAEVTGNTIEEISEVTTKNAMKLYKF